jgi:hypothetical protein
MVRLPILFSFTPLTGAVSESVTANIPTAFHSPTQSSAHGNDAPNFFIFSVFPVAHKPASVILFRSTTAINVVRLNPGEPHHLRMQHDSISVYDHDFELGNMCYGVSFLSPMALIVPSKNRDFVHGLSAEY